MTVELSMVAALIALGLFQLALTAIEYRRVHGVKYANTARDVASEKSDSKLLGRLSRAQSNLMETAPYFIGLAVIIHVVGLSTDTTQLAAIAFVALRVIYLPLYAFGVPDIRGLVWTLSFVALCVMAYAVLIAVPWAAVHDPVLRLIQSFGG
jgi:uncharacterized MAPEG superfamily protein